MEKGQTIHGFIIESIRPVEEIKAEAWQLTHEKTGARVLWLKRADENKTFSIGFQTIPSDDTGVFHILEHSVLNGSDKYPVKEPFVDLLKGSLNTFLNAMTWPDKTMYPVSSRNNKDFINLMRVYLDAVFAPLCISRENIFRQEGWHYELKNEQDDPLIKGVVYNEMKGAYSSPERLASQELMGQLFADNSYGFSSGGDPKKIPELTYEKFIENYHKFYNATNAVIILDGDMDLEEILGVIDEEYLAQREYTPRETFLKKQPPLRKELKKVEFDATSLKDKTIIDYGYVVGNFDDYEKSAAFALIASVLTDENQSVLKQAVLQSGLAQDISMTIDNETYQPYVEIMVNNTNPENEGKLTALIRETLEKVVREGLNREEMAAILNNMEFKARERDFGSTPKGLVYAMQAAANWMYGGDPLDGITVEAIYRSLREKLQTSYFEELIERYLLNSEHCASVMAVPVIGLESRAQQAMAEKMKAYKASLSKEQVGELVKWNQQFEQWQMSVDTPEEKATLPSLDLRDISEEPLKLEYRTYDSEGVPVIEYDNSTEGIQYCTLYFDLKDLTLPQLQEANMLVGLLSHLDTENHEAVQLNQLTKKYLGSLSFAVNVFDDYHTEDYQTKMCVSFSFLKENAEKAWQLVSEIMYRTLFNNRQEMLDLLRQGKNELEMAFTGAGHTMGILRALASCDERSTVREYISGYQFYNHVKEVSENLSDQWVSELEDLYRRLFTRERLTVSLMSEGDHQLLSLIMKDVPEGQQSLIKPQRPLLTEKAEAIEIAAQISYACQAVRSGKDLSLIAGKLMLIRKILSMDYLWTNIRAMGGAYGCGFAPRGNNFVYYSYRDPNPSNSLKVYGNTHEYLRQLCQNEEDLHNYIIGTIGDSEPLLSNRALMATGDGMYFSGITYQLRKENRRQILTMNTEEVKKLLPLFDFDPQNVRVCVVGGKEAIEQCGEKVRSVLKL